MHESSTEAIHPYEKCWKPGTLQLVATQTIILSSCQDNTQFYCHLIYVISIYCHTSISFVLLYLSIFVHYFPTFLYIYIFISAFYTSLFIGCRLTIESSVFLILLTRERLFNFSIMTPWLLMDFYKYFLIFVFAVLSGKLQEEQIQQT